MRRVAEGNLERGVSFVRREVRDGNTESMPLREVRWGRRVDEMSSFVREGKTMFGWEKSTMGFPRRDRVLKLCRWEICWIASSEEIWLYDRSRCWRWGVGRGDVNDCILLYDAERERRAGKEAIREAICWETQHQFEKDKLVPITDPVPVDERVVQRNIFEFCEARMLVFKERRT